MSNVDRGPAGEHEDLKRRVEALENQLRELAHRSLKPQSDQKPNQEQAYLENPQFGKAVLKTRSSEKKESRKRA